MRCGGACAVRVAYTVIGNGNACAVRVACTDWNPGILERCWRCPGGLLEITLALALLVPCTAYIKRAWASPARCLPFRKGVQRMSSNK